MLTPINEIYNLTKNRMREWLWNKEYERLHPQLVNTKVDTQKLRLILGVGRSGTTWLSRVLLETPTPIRFFMEGLYFVKPKLKFSEFGDFTAIHYSATLPENNSLLRIYRSFLAQQYYWSALGVNKHLQRNDSDWQLCVVKEVHSLLATEALLTYFNCPTVFVTRNPIYLIDSLFARDGLHTIYLCHESRWVFKTNFIKRFAPEHSKDIKRALQKVSKLEARQQIVLYKLLSVALIQLMFNKLFRYFPNICLVSYEDLCQNPQTLFPYLADFLGLNWDQKMQSFLMNTGNPKKVNTTEKYPVFKDTSKNSYREFQFLNSDEVSLCQKILNDLGVQ
jgi:hypothetical protein